GRSRHERNAGVVALRLVAQVERVVDELSPEPADLRDTVLREDVLADVVEDAVADVTRRRAAFHRADPVGVRRGRGDARVVDARLSPRRVRGVVAAAVERAELDSG